MRENIVKTTDFNIYLDEEDNVDYINIETDKAGYSISLTELSRHLEKLHKRKTLTNH